MILCILLLLPISTFCNLNKIDPKIIHLLNTRPGLYSGSATVDAVIYMKNGDITPRLKSLIGQMSPQTRLDPATAVYTELRNFADKSQRNVLGQINHRLRTQRTRNTPKISSFWISNIILIQGADKDILSSVSENDEVDRIELAPAVYSIGGNFQNLKSGRDYTGCKNYGGSNSNVSWGLERVRAPEVWSHPNGTRGEGIVVGIIDTGARGTHEALAENFVGEYGWFDPYEKSSTPYDKINHGSHVTGLAIGKGIGVAPGSKWMSCSHADPFYFGGIKLEYTLECMQFMLCPHLHDGSQPDCRRRPAVINNSWYTEDSTMLIEAMRALRTAGIIPVFAAGNIPFCERTTRLCTAETICIGNILFDNSLSVVSSRGPGIDQSVKPDIVAPGTCLLSAGISSDDKYIYSDGTSMASPMVVGVMALLLSAQPDLTFDQILKAITETANRDLVFSGKSCGGIPDNIFPNNHFGFGLIDAYAAYNYVLNKEYNL